MFSWYQFDIPMLMSRYLPFSIIQILNKKTSRVQKTDWDVSTTATDKFILLCPALLIIHHEYKGRDVLLGTLLRPFILHYAYAYSCIKLNKINDCFIRCVLAFGWTATWPYLQNQNQMFLLKKKFFTLQATLGMSISIYFSKNIW